MKLEVYAGYNRRRIKKLDPGNSTERGNEQRKSVEFRVVSPDNVDAGIIQTCVRHRETPSRTIASASKDFGSRVIAIFIMPPAKQARLLRGQ
ncbi:MAG: hypothetical protein LBH18_03640 [Spirochaetaceae bacterium]|jgi:hypothetical protein|nr:hypothetical protein [Spirochaetaceae bacterium]